MSLYNQDKLVICFGFTSILQGMCDLAPKGPKKDKLQEHTIQVLDRLSGLFFSPDSAKVQAELFDAIQQGNQRDFIHNLYSAMFFDDLPIKAALELVEQKKGDE